jgi:hypothetical protein
MCLTGAELDWQRFFYECLKPLDQLLQPWALYRGERNPTVSWMQTGCPRFVFFSPLAPAYPDDAEVGISDVAVE